MLQTLLGVLAVLAIFGAGWKFGADTTESSWLIKWGNEERRLMTERSTAIEKARGEEQRRWADRTEVAKNAQDQESAIRLGTAQLSVDAGGLRLDAVAYAERASSGSCDTAPATRGDTATRAAMVLSDLLGRCSATLEELAPAFDRTRNAAVTCNGQYNSLIKPQVAPR